MKRSQGVSAKLGRQVVGVFCIVYAVYVACPIVTTFDSKWIVPTVLSMLREGNLDLDEYALAIAHGPHRAVQVNGHWYNLYPLGPALIALPFVAAFDGLVRAVEPLASVSPGLSRAIADWRRHFEATGDVDLEYWNTTQRLIASAVVALAAAAFFLVSAQFLSSTRAFLLTGVFAFCTSCFSTASRALWQHGPSVLFLTLALLSLVRAQTQMRWLWLAGFSGAMSYVMRPTNSVSVAFISVYVLLTYRRMAWKYLIAAAMVGLPWAVLNVKLYRSVLPPYYWPGGFLFVAESHFAEGLLGTLVSPARGLLTFTPVLLFVPWGIWIKARSSSLGALDLTLLAVIVFHWLVIASSVVWWAGHSYGPRFFSDMIPFLGFFLIPVIGNLGCRPSVRQRLLTASFAALSVLSFLIHLPGATSWEVYLWNVQPIEVGLQPARLWNWKDLQPLRALRPIASRSWWWRKSKR